MILNKIYLVIFLFVVACSSEPNHSCSKTSSNEQIPQKIYSLGGYLEIENLEAKSYNCTALFELNPAGDQANVITSFHCLKIFQNAKTKAKIFDGSGYKEYVVTSDYLKKLSAMRQLAKDNAIPDSKVSLDSKLRLIYENYSDFLASNEDTRVSRELKQEVAAFGKPLCHAQSDQSDQSDQSTGIPDSHLQQVCFLHGDVIKFSVNLILNAKEKSDYKRWLVRSIKLGALMDFKDGAEVLDRKWSVQLLSTSENLLTTLAKAQYAFSCFNSKTAENPFIQNCDPSGNIIASLSQAGFDTNELTKGTILDSFNYSDSIKNLSEERTKLWDPLENGINTGKVTLLGNVHTSTEAVKFSAMDFKTLPSKTPHALRSYGILSHFDSRDVDFKPSASGSLLMLDGKIIATLSSVNGKDTSGGLPYALRKSKHLDEPVELSKDNSSVVSTRQEVMPVSVSEEEVLRSQGKPNTAPPKSSHTPDETRAPDQITAAQRLPSGRGASQDPSPTSPQTSPGSSEGPQSVVLVTNEDVENHFSQAPTATVCR